MKLINSIYKKNSTTAFAIASFIFLLLTMMQINLHATVIESTTRGSIGKKSNNCKGLGLCFSNSSLINFLFVYDNSTLELKIKFDQAELERFQPIEYNIIKGKKTITFDEDIELPPSVLSALYLHNKIPKGSYSLDYDSGKFIISIKLRN